MKRVFLSIAIAVAATCAMAALPFNDAFASGGPGAGWTEWFNTGGSVTCVASDVDWRSVTVNPPSGSDGYFGKSTYPSTDYQSHGWVAGDTTDTNYTVEAKIFVPQVSGLAEPDDYLYQMLLVYVNPGLYQYIRYHAQYNNDTANRVRVQVVNGAFAKTVAQTNVFSGGDAWHTFKAVLNGNGGDFYLDGALVSGATISWATEAASVTAGQFGFGQYVDGAGTRSVYVDAFSAVSNAGISDWSQFE